MGLLELAGRWLRQVSFQTRLELSQLSCLCLQLLLLSANLPLLLLDGVQHGPQNRIVVHQQIPFVVRAHRFWNHFFHFLSDQADVLLGVVDAQGILLFVLVTNGVELQDLLEAGMEAAEDILEPAVRESVPRAAAKLIGRAIDRKGLIRRDCANSDGGCDDAGHWIPNRQDDYLIGVFYTKLNCAKQSRVNERVFAISKEIVVTAATGCRRNYSNPSGTETGVSCSTEDVANFCICYCWRSL